MSACADAAPFALQVLGDSMEPEFCDGEIVIAEPVGSLVSGCFVIAACEDGYVLRMLDHAAGRWMLTPLNDRYPSIECRLEDVRGRVVAKSDGRGRQTRQYLSASSHERT